MDSRYGQSDEDNSGSEQLIRQRIVEEARTYLGTPYEHKGRKRDVALDCSGLVICVGCSLGLLDPKWMKFRDYSREPDGQSMLQMCRQYLIEIPIERFQVGSILLFRIRRHPQHLGIVSPDSCLIHAYEGLGQCKEHVMDEFWTKRIVAAFEYPGVR